MDAITLDDLVVPEGWRPATSLRRRANSHDGLVEIVHNISRHPLSIAPSELTPAYQEWLARGRRKNRRLVRSLRHLGRHEQADRVDFCRTACKHQNGTPFDFSCHEPLCFFCGSQRQRRLSDRHCLAACCIQNPLFITLTLRDFRYLDGVRERLVADFLKMRRLQHFKERCSGGFYCLEASFSPSRNLFHPHVHALIDAVDLSKSWLSRTWHGYTSAYIVDLRIVPRGEIKPTFLYMLKGPCRSLEPRAVSEIYSSFTGGPLFQPFGSVKLRHGLCRQCREQKTQIAFGETCGHARHWE